MRCVVCSFEGLAGVALAHDVLALHAAVVGCGGVGVDGVLLVESSVLGVAVCFVSVRGIAAGVWNELPVCDSDDDCYSTCVRVVVHVSISV